MQALSSILQHGMHHHMTPSCLVTNMFSCRTTTLLESNDQSHEGSKDNLEDFFPYVWRLKNHRFPDVFCELSLKPRIWLGFIYPYIGLLRFWLPPWRVNSRRFPILNRCKSFQTWWTVRTSPLLNRWMPKRRNGYVWIVGITGYTLQMAVQMGPRCLPHEPSKFWGTNYSDKPK